MLKHSLHERSRRLGTQIVAFIIILASAAIFGFWVSRSLKSMGISPDLIILTVFFIDTSSLFLLGFGYYLCSNRIPRYRASVPSKGMSNGHEQKPYSGQTPPSLESVRRARAQAAHPQTSSQGLFHTRIAVLRSSNGGPKALEISLQHTMKPEGSGNASNRVSVEADVQKKKELQEQHLQLSAQRERLAKIISEAKRQIEFLEENMIDKMNRVTCGAINKLVSARRIANSLEGRLLELDGYLAFPSAENLIKVQECLTRDLLVPNNSLSSVMNAQDLPPLPASCWESTLENLLGRIISRKELFRASKAMG